MFSLKQVSLSVAALGAILTVGSSSTPAQALNIVSGSVSGIWQYDYSGAGIVNVGDAFTANYTYDSDSITGYDSSISGLYKQKQRRTSLLSLVLNSGSYSYTFDFSPSVGGSYIEWYDFQSTSSTYGLHDHESIFLVASDYPTAAYNSFYAYTISGLGYSGNSLDSSYASAYSQDYNTGTFPIGAYTYNAKFSGATPAPTAVPTPALLPGLVSVSAALLRKREQNQGQETAETAEV
ncbi:MAG: PTPA-CTERM sorting domain-containing protein [Synechococcales cyanobacterium M58_A2018_015]|nr:PTPA-CTERM sorting domain-containing protein [Synechococcales cyanobacterium M58_A2018_015]